jgi:Lysozyme inhibitor LprI
VAWATSSIAAADRVASYVPPAGDVVTELSHRSNLPEADLQQSLANCDANQMNTNLCAYRDQVAADLTLKHVIAGKQTQHADAINEKIAKWEKKRDAACAKSAAREFGEGSMKPTALATCVAAETKKMIRWVENQK